MSAKVVKEWVTESGYRAAVVLVWFDDSFYPEKYHCGYVEVPKNHALYKAEYTDKMPLGVTLPADTVIGKRGLINAICGIDLENPRIDGYFDVHGGITYDGSRGEPDTWWFGFDCHHLDDNIGFCDEAYVEGECENLAKQLKTVQENAQIKSSGAGAEQGDRNVGKARGEE